MTSDWFRDVYDLRTIGGRLKAARELAGQTQSQLGRRLRLTPKFVSQIERDVRPMPARKIAGACMSLKIKAPWLLGVSEEGGPPELVALAERRRARNLAAEQDRARVADLNRERKKFRDSRIAYDSVGIEQDSTRDTSSLEAPEPET